MNDKFFIKLFFIRILLLTLLINLPTFSQNPEQSVMDINNITLWVRNDGFHDWVVKKSKQYWSNTFPKGTVGGLFTEGLIWGGKVYDGNSQIIRVNGSYYSSGNSPNTRLYRVRTDYRNANLKDDAANFFLVDSSQITDSMITKLRNQYQKDWQEWPADKGAPFNDEDKDGKYDPNADIPGVPGASQTIWISYNDGLSRTFENSVSTGIDIQETYWAYDENSLLSNTIYKRAKIIYQGLGTTPADAYIDSMSVVEFSDIEIGWYADDFAGSDTSLNLGYEYNSNDTDLVYRNYLAAPPAIGYSIIQSAAQKTLNINDSAIVDFKWRRGYKYFHPRPLSVFVPEIPGDNYSLPETGNDQGRLEWYNYMRGYLPVPFYPASFPFYRPSQFGGAVGGYGTYLLDGDPVAGTGYIDGTLDYAEGITDYPGFRSIYVITGPFSLKLKDTVEVVLALTGGLGNNHLDSITKLKSNVSNAQNAYYKFVNDMTAGNSLGPNWPVIKNYSLYQNYPNPFNGATTIRFEVPQRSFVTIKIYDLLGREVKTLVNEYKDKDIYNVGFDGGGLSSGIYFYQIRAGSYISTRKMLILK